MMVCFAARTALVAMSILAPAQAFACDFANTGESVNLSQTGVIDPYGENFSRTVSVPLDDDCGTVWFEYDKAMTLSNGNGATLPVSLTVLNSSAVPGSDRRRIDANEEGITVRFDVALNENGVLASGAYGHISTLTLWDAATGGAQAATPIALALTATIAQVTILSLNGGGLVEGAKVNLGMFEEDTPRAGIDPGLTLTAISNDPYRIEIDSLNDWRIVNTADPRYAIPYALQLDGQGAVGNPARIGVLAATRARGTDRPLTFSVTPRNHLRAGSYEDEVTITIFGNE